MKMSSAHISKPDQKAEIYFRDIFPRRLQSQPPAHPPLPSSLASTRASPQPSLQVLDMVRKARVVNTDQPGGVFTFVELLKQVRGVVGRRRVCVRECECGC